MATLGSMLAKTVPQLVDLIIEEEDRSRRARLKQEHRRLARLLRKLVDKNVRRDTREYRKAVESLEKANVAIRAAKKDLAKTGQAIRKIARALDWVGKAAALVA